MPHREPEEKVVYERLPFLEGLRGLAALYVVLSHICSMADPSSLASKASVAPYWLQATMAPLRYGHLAVSAFIVLSGFCLQLALFARGDGRIDHLGKWFARRARRILPAYYGALLVSMIVVQTVTIHQPGYPFKMYVPVTNESLWAHIFLVHNLAQDWMYKINGVLWSIGVEAQLYVLFPLLLVLLFKVGRTFTLALSIAVAAAVFIYVPHASKLYAWYLPLFVAGMIAANLAYRPSLTSGTQPALAALLSMLGFAIAAFSSAHGWPIYVSDGWAGLGIASLCYLLVVSPRNPINKTLGLRPLMGLGAFSYSLYLMHHPIQQILYVMRPAGTEGPEALFWYLLAFGLPAIFVGTWLFSLVFERPFVTRKIDRKQSRESLKPAPVELPLLTFTPQPEPAKKRHRVTRAFKPAVEALPEPA